jgi:crotonobetainyl-CoA:carnitine CoA-transferase CaiB-like acyl-CoA transferase
MQNSKPLSGYRVVELSTFMAAPSCGRLMADWGAEVIKVEAHAGDPWRFFGQSMCLPTKEDESPAWEMYNANKRGIVVDLKNAEGQQILHKLLETADVLITNNRPEALEKLNLNYDNLKEKYPRLVYALVTGFGEEGPDVDQPGFDVVAFWARSGFLADLVKPDEYPVYSPAGFGDLTVGLSLFGGICAALLGRQTTGKGDKVSVSLYGTAIWCVSLLVAAVQKRYGNKFPKARLEGNPVAIPYRCKDNEWIMLSILQHDRYWPAFCKALGREDLIDDERFKNQGLALQNRQLLIPILEETFKTRSSEEWVQRLREADIVHDRLRHFTDILTDEQAWANNYLTNYPFANGEKAILACTPIQSEAAGPLPYEKGPLLGEHTKEVLADLGYSAGEIEEFKNKKVIAVR